MTRIVLVDDHPVMRDGIRGVLLDAGFEVVAEVDSPTAATRVVKAYRPAAVVLDLALGAESGLSVLSEIASASRVLVHSMHSEFVRECLVRGAHGFVSKNAPAEILVSAVHALLRGERYVEPALAAELAVAPATSALSARERQVLTLLADGLTNREVASELSVSVRTVESVRAGLRNRLGLVTRADLVAYARSGRGGAG